MQNKKHTTDILLYSLIVLVWGTTWYAIKLQVGQAPAEITIFYRIITATTLLYGYCRMQRISFCLSKTDHFFLALMGLGLFSTHYLFLFEASKHLISGVCAVVFSTISFFCIIHNYFFFKTRPTYQAILGSLLGIFGLAIFFLDDFLAPNPEAHFMTSMGLCLIAALVFSLGTTASQHVQRRGLQIIPSMVMALAYGSAALAIYIVVKGTPLVVPVSSTYWFSMIYLVFFGSILAFFWYLRIVKSMGMEMAGYTTVLCPVLSLVVSYFLEGYQSSLYDLVGFVLIAVGNVLVFKKKKVQA